MSDDKNFVGGQDRARVSGSEDYEVQAFAEKHGISAQRVRDLIEQYGNDRETLEQEIQRSR